MFSSKKLTRIFTLPVCFLFIAAQAQVSHSTDQELLHYFNKIIFWRDYKEENDKIDKYDSLSKANEDFQQYLVRYSSKNDFIRKEYLKPMEDEGFVAAISPDSLFKIYSWDTWTGGTMHFFENVYQYKDRGNLFSKTIRDTIELGDPGFWYTGIFSISKNGNIYYLALQHAMYSNREVYQGIKVFSINNNFLDDKAKLIKTKSGLQNTLGFVFDFFTAPDTGERPHKLIIYNTVDKTLSIPVVKENGEVTTKRIVYRFTGEYFESKK